MKTIAICNHKGGVGKTALSMAIAEGLHRKGKRTLLVDLDQQMNATQQAKIDTTDEVTVYDLLTSFDYTAKDGIKHFDGGDIIPGDVLVSNAESDMAKLDTRLTMLPTHSTWLMISARRLPPSLLPMRAAPLCRRSTLSQREITLVVRNTTRMQT